MSDAHHNGHHSNNVLPKELGAPAFVDGWRVRALAVAAIFGILGLIVGFLAHDGFSHFLRAWLLGYMIVFGFMAGGLGLLMVQYVSGGKWGLLLRRPLEAMSRTIWFVFVLWIPIAIFLKKLYLWAEFSDPAEGLKQGLITASEAHAIAYKHAMLSPVSVIVRGILYFAIFGFFTAILNRWSLQRDAEVNTPNSQSPERVIWWTHRLENLSGPGIILYAVLITGMAIDLVMSLDVTWYSSVYGLQFLVGQGYAVLSLGVLTVIGLSKAEPMKTILRTTEQHDLGKFMFAFVMLNIYLAFAAFLIIWSANSPEEIPWYLNRIRGGWWVVCTLDFVLHWVLPFCILLSRDIKRNKTKLAAVCCLMLFARCVDMFWLIEPNFKDAARNLHFSFGILEYALVPVAVIAAWAAVYLTNLKARPLVAVNDPHLEQILEPEHVHA